MLNVRIVNQEVDRLLDQLAELGRLACLRDPITRLLTLEVELTPPQLHTMMWLGRDGALPMATLAARIGCTGSTATGIIDRLENLGYVARAPKPGDRRVVLVELTPQGEQVASELYDVIRQRTALFLDLLAPEDRQQLVEIFSKIVSVLRQDEGGSPDVELAATAR
jgi:DNA-binding MarR family transcriptional regulator